MNPNNNNIIFVYKAFFIFLIYKKIKNFNIERYISLKRINKY